MGCCGGLRNVPRTRWVAAAARATSAGHDELVGRDRSCATGLVIGAAAQENDRPMTVLVDNVLALSRFAIAHALRTSRLRRTADALSACAVENAF